MTALRKFFEAAGQLPSPVVVELGTRRVDGNPPSRRDHWIPHAAKFIGVDFLAGEDVDVVADLHRLSTALGNESCDVIISCSTFEHVKYPHLAAHEVMRTLRVGGLVFIQTHQTFPLHAFPHDYFRFSREGLAGLFGTKMGFEVLETEYQFPAEIHALESPDAKNAESFLNVVLLGRKVQPTPEDYFYEFD